MAAGMAGGRARRRGAAVVAARMPGAALRAHGGEALAERDLELLRGTALVVEPGHGDAGDPLADRALDARGVLLLVGGDEQVGVALHVRARGAAGAVDVILRRLRDVEVDDVR